MHDIVARILFVELQTVQISKLCDLVIYSSVSSVLVFSDGNSPAIAAIIFASDLFDC